MSSSQPPKIHFQQASYQDVGFLVFLRKLTMDEHLAKAGIVMNDLQHQARILEFFEQSFLIKVDDHVVGVIKLGIENLALHIRQFQILPECQGKGIGGQVIDLCKKKAVEKGVDLTLNVLLENPAKQLYLNHGFTVEQSDDLQHFMRWTA
ncbi:GNAT family N-acetyltransferase [Thalassotalea euphylliae]|uniref:GNAT family N-acetyltransferase n=1 Tax=Thalassotalea euphylliae TaxID=1655234 RepID=UPI00362D346B